MLSAMSTIIQVCIGHVLQQHGALVFALRMTTRQWPASLPCCPHSSSGTCSPSDSGERPFRYELPYRPPLLPVAGHAV